MLLISHDRDFLDRTVTSLIVPEGEGRWILCQGGYSDLQYQRKAEQEKRRKSSAKNSLAPQKSQAQTEPSRRLSKKLSFKQVYALETLPKILETLETEIHLLDQRLADVDFYKRDPKAFDACVQLRAEKEKLRAEKEEEWLTLALLQESLETASS